LRFLSTPYDRTDMLAEVFDARMFDGATFADLDRGDAHSRPRPHLLINATTTGAAERFVFDIAHFAGIGSSLAQFQVSRAVAASAALPGLLHPATLRDYTADFPFSATDISNPAGLRQRIAKGTDALSAHIRQALARRVGGGSEVVDDLNWIIDDFDADPRTGLLAPNVLDAVQMSADDRRRIQRAVAADDVGAMRGAARRLMELAYTEYIVPLPPMYRHLYDGGVSDNLGWETLKDAAYSYFSYAPATAPASGCFVFVIDAHPQRSAAANAFSHDTRQGLTYLLDYASVEDAVSSLMDQQRDRLLADFQDDLRVNSIDRWPLLDPTTDKGRKDGSKWTCQVWRLGFDRIVRLLAQYVPKLSEVDRWRAANVEVIDAHRTLEALLNGVATDLQLRGPTGCSPDHLRVAIRNAARILIHEDQKAIKAARQWFAEHFGRAPADTPAPALYRDARPAHIVTETRSGKVEAVECRP
jgi:hypothetical protein